MTKKICKFEDCDNPVRARGWCPTHWLRWSKYGDPGETKVLRFHGPDETIAARTQKVGSCLEWTASVGSHGYARVYIDGVRELAHRYVWARENGPLPRGAVIDHTCWNKRCLNPGHLRLATNAENLSSRNGAMPGRKHDLPRNVYFTKGKRYYVMVAGRRFGGVFDTIEEAAEVAQAARREMFGAFAGRG